MTLEKAVVASSVASASAASSSADLNALLLSPIGASGTTLQTLLTTGLASLPSEEASSSSSSSAIRTLADWLETHNPLRPRIEALPLGDSIAPLGAAATAEEAQEGSQCRSASVVPPPFSSQRSQPPRVTFLLGGRKTGTHELASEMERRLGYKKISVSELLSDNFRSRRLMEEGRVVEASVVLPVLLETLAKYPQISDFVVVGFPRSLKQLQFFEKEFPCVHSRLVYLEYSSKADLLEMSLRFDSRMDRLSMENAADALFTKDQQAVFEVLASRRALHKIPLSFDPQLTDFASAVVAKTWKSLGPIVKPKLAVVLGVPGAGLSSFARLLAQATDGGATALDVDASAMDAGAGAGAGAGADSVTSWLLAAAQQSGKFQLVVAGFPTTEAQFHTLGRVFEVTAVHYLRPDSVAALDQCKTRWLGRDATRSVEQFAAKVAAQEPLIRKFRAMSFLQETKFPADLSSVDPVFALAKKLMKPSSLFISGVPFSGRSALAVHVATLTGYPVIEFASLANKTPQGVVEAIARTRHSGSVIVAGAPCHVEFFAQLYGEGGLLPPPFAVVLLDKTHRPMEELTAKAQEWAEARETEFDAEKFAEEVDKTHSHVEQLLKELQSAGGESHAVQHVVRNSTETQYLLPQVTVISAETAMDSQPIAEELVNKLQNGVGIVDGKNFPLHGLGAALRTELKRISMNGNRRIPMAMLGGRLVLINTLKRLRENKFPTVMDALDSLRGHCQIEKLIFVGTANRWIETEARRLGFPDQQIVRADSLVNLQQHLL